MKRTRAGGDARRAALALHGLPECDQAWLLEQLPHAHRQLLQPLLDDLRSLGIAPDPALVPRNRPAAAPQEADRSTAALRSLLEAEPARLTAWLLAMPDSPHAARLGASLGPQRRSAALDALQARPPAPALQRALLQEVQQALQGVQHHADGKQPRGWKRMLQMLRGRRP